MFKAKTAFALSALLSAAIALPGTAFATAQQNYPSAACQIYTTTGNGNFPTSLTGTFNAYGQLANAGSSGITLACPLISNGSTISSAGVWFYSNGSNVDNFDGTNASIGTAVCQTYADGTGGACGTGSVYTGAAGAHSLSPSYSDYGNGGFNYMIIHLGPSSSGSDNVLFGYSITLSSS